jgi:hypothetical protein
LIASAARKSDVAHFLLWQLWEVLADLPDDTPLGEGERENGVAPSGSDYSDESSDDDDEEEGDDEFMAEVSGAPSISTATQVGVIIGLKLQYDGNHMSIP